MAETGKRKVAQGASFLSVNFFFFFILKNDLKQLGQRLGISVGLNN